MRSVIYLDVLLFTNGWISVVLLAACGVLCSQPCQPLRLILAGCAAAASSLTILLPPLPALVQIFLQAVFAAGIVRIAFCWKGLRPFFHQCLCYALMNFVLAGGVAAGCMAGSSWMETNNLACYFQISPGVLVGASLGLYMILCLVRVKLGGFSPRAQLLLTGSDWQLTVAGFCDTGLTVIDPVTGQDVVLVYYHAVESRLPHVLALVLQDWLSGTPPPQTLYPVHLLPCDTIGGQVLLPALSVQVQQGHVTQAMTAAFTAARPADPGCEALFGAALAQQLHTNKTHQFCGG